MPAADGRMHAHGAQQACRFSGTPRSPAYHRLQRPNSRRPDRPYLLHPAALHRGAGCRTRRLRHRCEANNQRTGSMRTDGNALYTLLEQDSNLCACARTRPNGEWGRSIKERARAATDAGASLLERSCQQRESTGQSHGFECFPRRPGTYSEESMRFAQCIAQKMSGAGHLPARRNGIRFAYYNGKSKRIVDSTDTKIREPKSFGIVERPYCPAVLVERCFTTSTAMWENWTEAGCARAARIYYEAIAPISAPSLCRRAAACERRTALSTNTAARPRPLRRGARFASGGSRRFSSAGAARLFHIVSAVQRNGACRHAHQRKHRAQHACPDAEPLRHRACDIRH